MCKMAVKDKLSWSQPGLKQEKEDWNDFVVEDRKRNWALIIINLP